jgi:hypothetical protein
MVLDKPFDITEEVNDLRFISKKIIQAYRIRLMCLKRRHEVLSKIGHDFDNISSFKRTINTGWDKENGGFREVLKNEDAFYSILDTNLKREIKLIEIIRRADKEGESNIIYALNQLKKYERMFGGPMHHWYEDKYEDKSNIVRPTMSSSFRDWIEDYSTRKLHTGNVYGFLKQMIEFLDMMQEDLLRVENRMVYEDLFLEKRDKANFDEFFFAWSDELNSNEELIIHFRKILKKYKKLIKLTEGQYNRFDSAKDKELLGRLAATGGGIWAAQSIYAESWEFIAVSVVITMVGLVAGFSRVDKFENDLIYKDLKLLKKVKKMRAIRKSLRKRLMDVKR